MTPLDLLCGGLALVPIPRGQKGPTSTGWNERANVITNPQDAHKLEGLNVGLAHAYCSPTATCAIDVDDYPDAAEWLGGRGINLEGLCADPLAVAATSQREGRLKLFYRLLAALVRFALETGMRRSELVRLEWQDIDFAKRLVTLHTSKNGQPRWIPLSQKALEQLLHQQAAGYSRPFDLTVTAISQAWPHVVKRAQLEDFRFHDLRHEALSRWAHRLGGDVFKLSLVSGHKTLQMARRYVHPVESELLALL